jgi:glyoxylase-like metal-dependent hydrolase (beta-lactamase superfamily II)
MGLLLENLHAAGFSAASIDTVLLTHIHPDHSNGLLTASGDAIFPRAEVMLHEDELAFWSDPALDDAAPAAAKPYLGSARALFAAYRGQLRPLRGGEVVAGITVLPLPGHTPGHSGYRVDSAGESLVIWGDTVHVPEIQVPHPVVTSEFDIDEGLAAENRSRIFRMVAAEGVLVAGMHLHLPAFAHLVPNGDGFRLIPETWAVAI